MIELAIVCEGTPNKRYHGHEGVVIRRLRDTDSDEILMEIRWDYPPPVDGLTLQVMRAEHIFVKHRPTDFSIEEEP